MTLVYSNASLQDVLGGTTTIAVVGASANPWRASHSVMRFLIAMGYRVYPVNPGLAGQTLLGLPVHASLADVPEAIDMVDIFRNSAAAGSVVDEALALPVLPKFIWMQIGVRHDDAARRAEAMGLTVIMDRCPAIEYPRLAH